MYIHMYQFIKLCLSFPPIELAREERETGATFRTGAITPDGLIDEDFEEELGSPSQVSITHKYIYFFFFFFPHISLAM